MLTGERRMGVQWKDAIGSAGPRPGSKSCTVVHGSPRAIFLSSWVKMTGPCTIVEPIRVGS
jgi:hypothetical protein